MNSLNNVTNYVILKCSVTSLVLDMLFETQPSRLEKLYSGGSRFESLPGAPVILTEVFVAFIISSTQISGEHRDDATIAS
jgi:hypothetical protein